MLTSESVGGKNPGVTELPCYFCTFLCFYSPLTFTLKTKILSKFDQILKQYKSYKMSTYPE